MTLLKKIGFCVLSCLICQSVWADKPKDDKDHKKAMQETKKEKRKWTDASKSKTKLEKKWPENASGSQ